MKLWSIVVAGGSGARFGRLKQLEPLRDRRVLDWSVDAMSLAGPVVLVVPASEAERTDLPGDVIVAGGASRSASVRAGLDAVPAQATHVLIHDGARPLVSAAIVDRVTAALAAGADAVVPVIPVTDTLRDVTGHAVDRSQFVAVQTPQGFELSILRRAHGADADATDDATLIDQLGGSVVHVDGEPQNLKITQPTDLSLAEVLLDAR